MKLKYTRIPPLGNEIPSFISFKVSISKVADFPASNSKILAFAGTSSCHAKYVFGIFPFSSGST